MALYATHRLKLRLDGLIMSKQLRPHQLLEVLTHLRAVYPRLKGLAPTWAQAPLDEIKAEIDEVYDQLLAEVGVPEVIQTPIPEALLEELALLQRDDDLRSLREVNHLLDHLIGGMANIIHALAQSSDPNSFTQSARRLEGLWFAQGRAFLKQASRRQWAETQRLFARPSAQTQADLQLLHQHRTHARIMLFNDWFARLLGLDPDQPIPEELLEPEPDQGPPAPTQQEIEARADALLNRLLSLTSAVWHKDTDPQHLQARQLAVGLLIDKLQERRSA